MIKRIAQPAGFAGLLAALLLTLLQILWVTPLILEAETYEKSEPGAAQPHEPAPGVAAQAHDEEAWEPEDGWQRTLSTTGGNLVVAVGFALMLAGLFTLRAPGQTWQGLLWGLAGYAVFCLAPSLGLPPELPGTAAADLVQRQYWWIATAAATAGGLALLVFGGNWPLKRVGAVRLARPHLFGAPQPEVHASLAPEALAQRFVVASLVSNALFWAALGLAAAWLFRRNRGGVDAGPPATRDPCRSRVHSASPSISSGARMPLPIPSLLIAGIGCRRGGSAEHLRARRERPLGAYGRRLAELDALASIDGKRDEPGLRQLATLLERPVHFLAPAVLHDYEPRLLSPSAVALRETGCSSGAEAAALALAERLGGGRADLLGAKRSDDRASIALARLLTERELP
ncbi:CbtA family protein [Pseudomonas aeruginosa]|nr:CbtA family protein [Pseudomonas aeruginosa]